ncbi:MAG: hypothetical protein MR450_06985 [Prevotella sp.]|nr:hypothetical protein [Prevotella sp.]
MHIAEAAISPAPPAVFYLLIYLKTPINMGNGCGRLPDLSYLCTAFSESPMHSMELAVVIKAVVRRKDVMMQQY